MDFKKIFTSELCKVCGGEVVKFLSLGKMPIANAFVPKEKLDEEEFFYDLEAGYCPNCYMVQLLTVVPYEMYLRPNEVGKRNYLFFSSTSEFMKKHFKEFADEVSEKYMEENSLVVDIGSNDGITLQGFDRSKFRVLGIEPAHNVAEVARQKGIETVTEYVSEDLAKTVLKEKGKVRAILSSNVILNIADINELMRSVSILLEDDGVFAFEDPYLPIILKNNTYDQFYDEHIYYFTAHSISKLAERHGMELFDAKFYEVHGGSMRFYLKRKNNNKIQISDNVSKIMNEEKEMGISNGRAYSSFASSVAKNKEALVELLKDLKSHGKKIVGYAAASKGTIVTNYCGLTPEIIEYVSDNTPEKQGLYTPGMKIPVVSPDKFHEDYPDYAVVFAWNHIKEIMGKEQDYLNKGGKFIVFFPEVKVL